MDNDTEIQVISGLNKSDNIITGYKSLSKNLREVLQKPFHASKTKYRK